MKKKTVWISSAVTAGILLLGGTGVAVAASDGVPTPGPSTSSTESTQPEQALTGTELDQASAAALAKVGSGKVTKAEKEHAEGPEDKSGSNDGPSGADVAGTVYEVVVTLDNGQTVEVSLDKSYAVLQVGTPEAADAAEAPEAAEGSGVAEAPEGAESGSGSVAGATQPAK